MPWFVNTALDEPGLRLPRLTDKVLSQKGFRHKQRLPLFPEGCQPADVLPEVRGLALRLCQHEHLLLRERAGQGGVLLPHQEVVVGPGDSWRRGEAY